MKRKIISFIIIVCIAGLAVAWVLMGNASTIPFSFEKPQGECIGAEEETVMEAISLSYFVYGCENAKEKIGTIQEILEQNELGIILENFGVKRVKEEDPASALIDTAAFIKNHVGN